MKESMELQYIISYMKIAVEMTIQAIITHLFYIYLLKYINLCVEINF